MAFKGWPAAAFDFYEELAAHNDKAWWQEHRDVYDDAVKRPFDELEAAVLDEFGPLRLFRPYRDTRFSKDKTPYKLAAGAMTESEGGATCYVQVSAEGLFLGGGMYHLATDQLERFRAAIAADGPGGTIAGICDGLAASGYDITAAETLKTAPRGWDKAHQRIELARRKGLVMARMFPRATWQSTAKALDRVLKVWHDAAPLNEWLERHVGPSELPPPGFDR